MPIKHFLAQFTNQESDHQADDLELEEQSLYITYLMKWYAEKRSTYMANLIVKNLELFRQCTDDCDDVVTLMKCERLIRQWRYLAQKSNDASLIGAW